MIMKHFIVINSLTVICTLVTVSHGRDFLTEDGVIVIQPDNFEDAAAGFPYLLITLYSPTCPHCQALGVEFSKAATLLKAAGSPAYVAKIDAVQYPDLAERFQVRGYPTLKFVRKQKTIDYTGGYVAEEIVDWINRRSRIPAQYVSTVQEAKAAMEKQEITFVGFFHDPESESARAFLEVASEIEDNVFLTSSHEAVLKEYKITQDAITVFRKLDEERTDVVGGLTAQTIRDFIIRNRLPLVTEFTQQLAPQIFGGDVKAHIILFISKTSDQFLEYCKLFRTIAREFKGKVLSIYVNIDDRDSSSILDLFEVRADECPTYRYVDTGPDLLRYQPEATDTLTLEGLRLFIQQIQDGRRKSMLKSEEIPFYWNARPVKVLVGKNFDEVARDRSKNVFVKFYAPWCGHCMQVAPIWEELGEMYKNHEDVIIAKMDSTANELADVRIQGYPSIKFFPKDSDEVIDYIGKMTLESFVKFIESGGQITDEDSSEHRHGDQSKVEL